ncbi:Gfo/Idh/MocA family protein [Calditerrivibrio nitroreducens]|uniref:Oxidoreductase domain protein n=1 Tax=Calditerrivibrio nitroreducens (strain DSM 19672 / NBRC 101217 / Yu37-1) TaxID=768670 RepID=E4TGE8_CALNY|nr:Gfo/Idh/MocA family oxidoreductase [Calditerrivibrio nitroreducens]ADR18629.1 oxidoreductase domain protein [Calditerrivibrio nitroreducens DSM 19672]
MKKLKLAFIGGGINSIAGYPHFAATNLDGKFEILAGVFSRNKEINLKTAERYNVKYIFHDVDKLLDEMRDEVDIIVILTPTPFHYEHTVKAIKKGFAVFCEKPLFKTLKEIKNFEKEFINKSYFLAVSYNYIGYPLMIELRDLIQKGMLGDIVSINLEMPQESFLKPPKGIDYPSWWRKKDDEIPTIALDLASHLFSMSYFLTKENITEVISIKSKYSKFGVIDDIKASVKYENSTTGILWVSKVALGNRNGLKVSVYGTKGSAVFFQEEPEKIVFTDSNGIKTILDRASNLEISKNKLYNRMIPGHPSGYIEAFANIYSAIYDSYLYYIENGVMKEDPLIWTFDKEKLNFEFLSKL